MSEQEKVWQNWHISNTTVEYRLKFRDLNDRMIVFEYTDMPWQNPTAQQRRLWQRYELPFLGVTLHLPSETLGERGISHSGTVDMSYCGIWPGSKAKEVKDALVAELSRGLFDRLYSVMSRGGELYDPAKSKPTVDSTSGEESGEVDAE